MRSGLLVKCAFPIPPVGMIAVAAPPVDGTQTNSAAAGPKKAAPASCISRCAARVATMRSPLGDQDRSAYNAPFTSVVVVHPFLGSLVARTIEPPCASCQVAHASDLPSGDQTGPYSPSSDLLTRCGVPLGRSTT